MQTFGVFVKHPVPGGVKTRLADAIGAEAALRLYTAFLQDLVRRFRDLDVRRRLGFTPHDAPSRAYFIELAGAEYELWPQPSTDLGRRMFAFFSDQLQEAGDQAVLIGSDSPNLPKRYVQDAFDLLDRSDIVLGPAADGGYYLIGMKGPVKDIFQGVSWSKPTVLSQTVKRIRELGLNLGLLPMWYDIDTPADLEMLRGHLAALIQSGDHPDCPATWDALSSTPESAALQRACDP